MLRYFMRLLFHKFLSFPPTGSLLEADEVPTGLAVLGIIGRQ